MCSRSRRLRSSAESINSGRRILESRCADCCANDAFLTSFRATLTGTEGRGRLHTKQMVNADQGSMGVHTIGGGGGVTREGGGELGKHVYRRDGL